MAEISHPLAEREDYFLSAPLGWLEDFYSLPGELTVVDMPELTSYIGKQSGGNIICQCTKGQLYTIITSFKQPFLETIEQVIKRKEKRKVASAAMAAENDPWSAVSAAQFMKGDEPIMKAPGQTNQWGENVPMRAAPKSSSKRPNAGAPAPPLPNAGAPTPAVQSATKAAAPASQVLKSVVRKPESRKIEATEGPDLPMHFMRALIPQANQSQSSPPPQASIMVKLIDPTAVPTATSRAATALIGTALAKLTAPAVSRPASAPVKPPASVLPPMTPSSSAAGASSAATTAQASARQPQSSAPPAAADPWQVSPFSGLPRAGAKPGAQPARPTEAPASAASQIKSKAMELMRSAYGVRDWVLPTWQFSMLDPKEREFNKAALDYILKKGWAIAGKDANVFLLTKIGAAQVEDTLEI
jgi:ribonuclease E